MNVIEIKNTLLQSSSYLIGCYLIDCGDGEKIIRVIEKFGIDLKGVLLTHCHQDHICGLPYVMDRHPKAKIYCSLATFKGLKDDELNLQYIIPEYSFEFHYDYNVVIIEEGFYLLDDDTIVEVVSTKGHSNDSQSYIIDGNIFTGDAHIPFAKVFIKWPTSVKADAIKSEQKILNLALERGLAIKAGHWIEKE